MRDHQHRDAVKTKFAEILSLLNEARADFGHDPAVARQVSIAITDTETAALRADVGLVGTVE